MSAEAAAAAAGRVMTASAPQAANLPMDQWAKAQRHIELLNQVEDSLVTTGQEVEAIRGQVDSLNQKLGELITHLQADRTRWRTSRLASGSRLAQSPRGDDGSSNSVSL